MQRSKTVRSGDGRPGSGVREAERELAKPVSEVAKGNLATGTETVGELLEHAEAIGRSPTTLKEYRRIAETILRPELGRLRLARLTAVDLDRLYAKLIFRGLKPITVRHVHALIGVALHQGEKWGLLDRDVSRRATPPPVHPSEVEAPNVEEVRAIIAAAEEIEPPFAAMLIITALVGARRGEMCGLRWSDFDSNGRTLAIARSVYDAPGRSFNVTDTKTHARRRVSLDDLAVEVLSRHRAQVDALARELGVTVAPDAYMFSRSPAGLEPYLPDVAMTW
jgi:integrase